MDKVDFKRILVIRLDRIGDVVCCLPAVKALKDNFPESSITFLSTSYTKDLLVEDKNISRVITYDSSAGISAKLSLFKELRKGCFNLAVIFSPYLGSALLAYLSGAKLKIGYPRDRKSHLKHEVESCLDIVRELGINAPFSSPVISINSKAEAFAKSFFTNNNILTNDSVVGIHPGASHDYRRWNEDGFSEVIDRISSANIAKVVLFGARKDLKIINRILEKVKHKPVFCGPSLSLQQLAAVIKECDCFVGNSSGPIHIAAGVGTPTVSIFGNTHPLDSENKWAPIGDFHVVARKTMGCKNCHPAHCSAFRCLSELKSEDVFKAVSGLLEKIRLERK